MTVIMQRIVIQRILIQMTALTANPGIARLLLTVHRAALLIHPAPQVQELILVPLP